MPKKGEPRIGDEVRAMFVPKNWRRGSINDIDCFEVRG
jgi:uncharacterized OB-fold protein